MYCQVYFGEHKASAGDTKSVDTHTRCHPSSSTSRSKDSFEPIPQWGRTIFSIFEWLQLRGLMFINNVHYSGVYSVVLSPDEEAGVYSMYVCESPEVSSPGGCSVAPPSGPERQRRPLLETKTDGFVTSERPRQLTQMSMRAKWKEFQWQLEQHWDQNVFFFCRISWSGVTLVPWQILLFSSANQDTPNQKKPLKARTDAKGGVNSRQPPSCPFFVSVNSSTTRTAAHSKLFFH